MPETYRVTDPKTGLKVRITGDSPPTEAELEEIFAKLSPAQQPTRQPTREDESMASLREMAGMTDGLSESDLDARVASPVGSTVGPAMVGAMAVPAIGASPLMRAAASPVGMGAIRAGVEYGRGGGPLDIALEGARGAGDGVGLQAFGAGMASLPGRLQAWIRRGKAAAPVASVAKAPAEVVPIAARSAPAAEATAVGGIAPGTTKVADGTVYEWGAQGGWRAVGKAPAAAAPAPAAFPKNPAEAAAKMRPKAAPKAEPDSSTLEQQLRESVKLSKGARKQLGNAQALEAKIVDWKTRQGLSEPQIVNALKESQGFVNEPGMARQVVDMVLRAHGLKR